MGYTAVSRSITVAKIGAFRCIQTEPFAPSAVQEICERALVNRNTFYKYYPGKSGLAGKMIAEFKQGYAELLHKRLSAPDVRTVMKELMPELYEKRRILLALWKIDTKRHRLFHDMQQLLKNAF